MSVINNVLKDIKNKPSAFTPLELADVPGSTAQNYYQPLAWISGFVLLSVLALVIYFSIQTEMISLNMENQIVESVEVPVVFKAIDSQPVEPALKADEERTGLQFNETKDFLELSLQLPLGAQSFLKKSSENRYVFFISNAGKKVIAPDITNNAWLKSITVDETDAGLEIQFYTRDKILVETLSQEKDLFYYWSIRLKKPAIAPRKEKPVKRNKQPEALVKANISEQKNIVKPDVVEVQISEKVRQDRVPQKKVKLEIKPVVTGDSDAELLRKADVSIQQKSWALAQKQLEQLLNSSMDKKVRIKLLSVYQLQKNTRAMKALLAKSLQLYPQDNAFLVTDAGQLFSESQFLTLIRRYKNNLNNLKLINLVAASFQRLNQHKNAISYFQMSLKTDSQQPRKWVSLAISQEQVSKFENSVQSYKMALRSGPLNRRLQTFIKNRLQQLKDTTQ